MSLFFPSLALNTHRLGMQALNFYYGIGLHERACGEAPYDATQLVRIPSKKDNVQP